RWMASIVCRGLGRRTNEIRDANLVPYRGACDTHFTPDVYLKRGMHMLFSDHLRKVAQPIWDAQLTHPFVVALGKGTLPERKFQYYILQDARFLGDLARVFAAGAQKAPDTESALRFADLVEETIVTERG